MLCVCVLVGLGAPASAHDLAIDQVMLWPDRAAGELRGEITFDPELTRHKDVAPSEEHARRAVDFLTSTLELVLDGRRLPLRFQVRELWVRGGATLGDVVRFSAPLTVSARQLRLHARGFEALIVSVQRVPSAANGGGAALLGPVETTSWLLGRDEWTPVYDLDAGWQEAGWRAGGPGVFSDEAARSAAGEPASGAPGAALAAPRAASDAAGGDGAGARPAGLAGLAARFVRLGFSHILPGGVDHVLFVAALVLAQARRYRQVLLSLSLFTLAHTLTLALGHFRLLEVSPRVVEPLIAFSIVVLGLDNLRAARSVDAPAAVRHLVVFSFGLVHGLGFASALSELAFDRSHLVLALFSFNLGVELGQIVVVSLLALLLAALGRWLELERYARLAGSAAIAASGLVLVIDRAAPADDTGAAASARMAPATSPGSRSPSPSLDRSL